MFIFMILLSWYGNTINVAVLLLFEGLGCICHCINGYLRQSINIMILNIVAFLIVVFGILKYFWS